MASNSNNCHETAIKTAFKKGTIEYILSSSLPQSTATKNPTAITNNSYSQFSEQSNPFIASYNDESVFETVLEMENTYKNQHSLASSTSFLSSNNTNTISSNHNVPSTVANLNFQQTQTALSTLPSTSTSSEFYLLTGSTYKIPSSDNIQSDSTDLALQSIVTAPNSCMSTQHVVTEIVESDYESNNSPAINNGSSYDNENGISDYLINNPDISDLLKAWNFPTLAEYFGGFYLIKF